MRLRAAQPEDLAAVSKLLLAVGLVPLDADSQFGPNYAVAATDEDEIVGFAGLELHGEDALLRSVAVAPEFRARGIAKALTTDRIGWARQLGVRNIWLLTTTAADYWMQLGFVRVERTEASIAIQQTSEWCVSCPASATAMVLRDSQLSVEQAAADQGRSTDPQPTRSAPESNAQISAPSGVS